MAATNSAAQLLIKGLGITDPASATKSAVSAYLALKNAANAFQGVETKTPENLAWKWLSLILAETVAQFLRALRKETELQGSHLDVALKEFLSKALELPSNAKFDAHAIGSPATHLAFSEARLQVPHLINAVTLWPDYETDKWQTVFDDCLARASFRVFEPDVAGRTSAPNIFIRATFGACLA